ncbi:MAG: BatA and WFA domain-containing protein, partial [Myxococcota bacterium]
MGLLTPLVGLLALLALPIVVAYFARRRAPKAVVGSTMLLRAAQGVASSRRAVARLRHPLSLFLVVCTLVALLVGLAGPRCGPSTEGRLIIVMDRSASMARKTASGQTLLQLGRDQVRGRLGLTAADAVALVLTGDEPIVAVGLTPDRSQVSRALEDTVASEGGSVSSAIALADRLCANAKRDRIWVVSDGGRVPETLCDVQTILLPKAGPNIGISALRGRVADGLGMVETLVAVTSEGGMKRSVDVELFMEGRLVDSFGIEVPGTGSAWTLRRLEGVGQNLKARIVGDGGSSAADDVASITLNERPTVQVGLVTRQPGGFLATALRLHPGANVEVVAPDAALTLRGKDLVVMEASAVLPPEGRIVAFGEAAVSLGFADGDALEGPKVTRWSFDDPLFRYVDLDEVVVRTARPLAVPEGGRSLIDAGGVPLAVMGQRKGRSMVAFGFGAGDTDLVLRVGFLHLVANLLE